MRALFFFALLSFSGCASIRQDLRASVADQARGELLLYLESFSSEAERIRFTVGSIHAIRQDGSLAPIEPRMRNFTAQDMNRQRLIAGGMLEPGEYEGLLFLITGAELATEDGEAALLVPEEPVRRNLPFRIVEGETEVYSLVLDYKDSLRADFSFAPAFRRSFSEKPLAGLTGYVSGPGRILVFDKKRMLVAGAIAGSAAAIAVDPGARYAYAALPVDDAVAVIDTASGKILHTMRLFPGDRPVDLIYGVNDLLMTVNEGSDSLSFMDQQGVEVSRISVGDGPEGLVMDAGSGRAYVLNRLSNSISIIDFKARSLIATVATDAGPLQGGLNRKKDRLYVIYADYPYMNVIDPSTFLLLKKVYLGMRPSALKVDPKTDLIYVARKGGGGVDVYDPFSFVPLEYIKTAGSVDFITIDEDLNRLLFVSAEAKTVTAVNINSRIIESAIDIGRDPYRARVIGER